MYSHVLERRSVNNKKETASVKLAYYFARNAQNFTSVKCSKIALKNLFKCKRLQYI